MILLDVRRPRRRRRRRDPDAAQSAPRTGYAFLDAALDPPGSVLAFAHRGGAEHPELRGLENTLAAFRHAVALGYGYLETDVHLTADGVLLAFHDQVLDRVTDRTGTVEGLTLAQVRRARIGGREPIPTLAELVEALPGCRFNIDVKSARSVPALARFVDQHGLHDRVCVGSFSGRRLRRFRRLTRGRVATSASPGEVAAFLLMPSARLADVLTRRGVNAFQIPHRRGPLVVAGSRLVGRAHRTRKHVHVWTVDDPDEMRLLVARGVDGLMTDRTDILRDVLEHAGRWRHSR